ncbi:flagellar hook-length control protein FliK [Nesterenkonia pannonica]|uniref:flagellar hook-length control protein FliK n=1 Tax=Nesterenkonia pannonica TaxID=1548602 RepID=UPI0021647FE4|nr:flagellar hook-length control protein FliK [Nesterenkonia pannonica]
MHSAAYPSASGAAPTVAQPLNAQLSTPVTQPSPAIVAAGGGEQVLTITVAPESLGPVTVRAHMTPEGMRIELFSSQEQGREALRGIVADLRRDLAGLGVSTGTSQVSVSDQEAPASQPSTHLGQHSRAADQQLLDAQQQSRQQFGEHARDGASAEADTPQAGPAAAADAEQGEPPLPDIRTHYIPGSLDLLA